MAASRSRFSNRPTALSAKEVGSSTRIAPGSDDISTGKPLSRKTSSIRWFWGMTSAQKTEIPFSAGNLREVGEQQRGEPLSLEAVRHRESDLGIVRAVSEEEPCPTTVWSRIATSP